MPPRTIRAGGSRGRPTRPRNAGAFERSHVYGFVNTLYQNNMDNNDLMDSFDAYAAEAYCEESFGFCKLAHAYRKRWAGAPSDAFPDAMREMQEIADLHAT